MSDSAADVERRNFKQQERRCELLFDFLIPRSCACNCYSDAMLVNRHFSLQSMRSDYIKRRCAIFLCI